MGIGSMRITASVLSTDDSATGQKPQQPGARPIMQYEDIEHNLGPEVVRRIERAVEAAYVRSARQHGARPEGLKALHVLMVTLTASIITAGAADHAALSLASTYGQLLEDIVAVIVAKDNSQSHRGSAATEALLA
jgi:hypothetical protein